MGCSLSWTTSCATWETRSPRRTCRRCSPRSATLRMRTASSPTCPSWTGSPARPKNQPKLQYLRNHLQTWLHNHHQKQGGAWRIYIKPKHFDGGCGARSADGYTTQHKQNKNKTKTKP